MALPCRRPGEDSARQRDGLRPPDAPPVPHPRGRTLPHPGPRRRRRTEPGVERHRARPHRRDRRHRPRRHERRALDGALPHRRAPRERHDVQLRCDRMTTEAPMQHPDVVVIGGGQAGLALGYLLAPQGLPVTILEAAGAPAAAWRTPWDSPQPFTPVRHDSLPGLTFPGDPDSYPGRDDVVAYLTDYAQRFELPVEFNSRVRSVRRRDDGGFLVDLVDRTYAAEQVVVATGPFQVPFTPAIAADLATEVVQVHSSEYRSPGGLPPGPVLVVGGGNTGYQIAAELAQSRQVDLAVGARQAPLPQRILGRDLFRYLEATGLMRKTVTSRIGQRLKDNETLVGSSPRGARKQGIRVRTRATGAQGTKVTFADGSEIAVDAIVWATGFRLDHAFVELPVFDDREQVRHERGVTALPGLYFLGLPWQHTRGSALLGWIRDDAEFIAQRIGAFARSHAAADASPSPLLSGPPAR